MMGKTCGCPICATNKAMRILNQAKEILSISHEAWVAHGAEMESSYYYLLDTVKTALRLPPEEFADEGRASIVEAMRILDKQPLLDWQDSVPGVRELVI